jgi:hypothetical protein
MKAPIEKVFDIITDHARYAEMFGLKASKLIREGKPHKNGVGAIREIDAGNAWFQEEVTHFERPVRLDYRIIKSRPPIDHQGGSVRLEKVPEGTKVVWTSTLHIRLPIIGGLVTRLMAPQLERAFHSTLKETERRAAA